MKSKFRNYLNRVILMFLVIFGMTIAIFTFVDGFIFKQGSLNLYSIIIALCGSIVLTTLLMFFFEINRMTLLVQSIVIYVAFLAEIYILGFFKGWFSIDNIGFVLASSILGLLGFGILISILIIKRNKENQELNHYLKEYQGRDKK